MNGDGVQFANITEILMDWLLGFAEWLLLLAPAFDYSGFGFGLNAILGPVSGTASSLGAWIPWNTVSIVLPISIGLYTTGLVLRGIKAFIPTIS